MPMGMAAACKARRILVNAPAGGRGRASLRGAGARVPPAARARAGGRRAPCAGSRGSMPACPALEARIARRPPIWSGWRRRWPAGDLDPGRRIAPAGFACPSPGRPGTYVSLTSSLISLVRSPPPEPHESGKAERLGAEVRAEGGLAEGDRRLPQGHPADRVRCGDRARISRSTIGSATSTSRPTIPPPRSAPMSGRWTSTPTRVSSTTPSRFAARSCG